MYDSLIYAVYNKRYDIIEECFISEDRDQLLDQFIAIDDVFRKHNKVEELIPYIRFPEDYELRIIGHIWPDRRDNSCEPLNTYIGSLDTLLLERRQQKNESRN